MIWTVDATVDIIWTDDLKHPILLQHHPSKLLLLVPVCSAHSRISFWVYFWWWYEILEVVGIQTDQRLGTSCLIFFLRHWLVPDDSYPNVCYWMYWKLNVFGLSTATVSALAMDDLVTRAHITGGVLDSELLWEVVSHISAKSSIRQARSAPYRLIKVDTQNTSFIRCYDALNSFVWQVSFAWLEVFFFLCEGVKGQGIFFNTQDWDSEDLGSVLAFPQTLCITLGKSVHLSVLAPQQARKGTLAVPLPGQLGL